MPERSEKFEDRTKKVHRLLSILRKIDNRESCTPADLSQEFETSVRNVYRDINDLNSAGFAIMFDKGCNSYRFADPDFTLRDIDLNNNELLALLLGSQIAGSLGKPFEDAYKSILKKVSRYAGDKTRKRVKDIETIPYFVDIGPAEGFDRIEGQYNAIKEAMDNKHEIEIVYKTMKSPQNETKRIIAPYGLFFHEGLWYVLGYCHLRRDIRTFALDCIRSYRITGRHYNIPPDFNMVDHFKQGWHMIQYGEPVEVVLKFANRYARWIKRRKWHPTQVIEEQKDGSLIFRVTLQGTRELKWWTYHWIPYCQIIAPPELREEVIGEMRAMLEGYGIDG